ncbi:MAG: PIN domain-containing protein [Blastochloris sp.]|nr:PIN domain-containing protein [Blastochloris sp.]
MTRTIVDTGALVALLDRGDFHHTWAVQTFKTLRPPLLTCESVLAETFHLLADLPASCEALIRLHREEIVKIDFHLELQAKDIWKLLKKYQYQPMDFADACLVRMTEVFSDAVVWTVDSDFKHYRQHGRQTIPLIFPN